MARPRVFISSTFYDLRQVRSELERFCRELGYEPVLNERGLIPYGSSDTLEEYCYREVELCDILVSVIGGRFGTHSREAPYSISQMELKKAFELGKQIYIFVERAVYSEFSTFRRNKGLTEVQYNYVDDVRVYQFLEELHSLPRGNPIAEFQDARDIVDYLKEQWAGLFHRFLQQQSRLRESDLVRDLEKTAQTLDQLVTFLTEERRNKDQAIEQILLANHPLFARLRELTRTPYRVFFTNLRELSDWLEARQFLESDLDSFGFDWLVWSRDRGVSADTIDVLRVSASLFDEDGKLKVITPEAWREEWVGLDQKPRKDSVIDDDDDDDIPF
ncbi:MAG: DUF4062 domain-containing protein [Anaerolineae bacterium]|jgi:hypothetical protein